MKYYSRTHVSDIDSRTMHTYKIRIGEMFNSKNICWIFDNSIMDLTQFKKNIYILTF